MFVKYARLNMPYNVIVLMNHSYKVIQSKSKSRYYRGIFISMDRWDEDAH